MGILNITKNLSDRRYKKRINKKKREIISKWGKRGHYFDKLTCKDVLNNEERLETVLNSYKYLDECTFGLLTDSIRQLCSNGESLEQYLVLIKDLPPHQIRKLSKLKDDINQTLSSARAYGVLEGVLRYGIPTKEYQALQEIYKQIAPTQKGFDSFYLEKKKVSNFFYLDRLETEGGHVTYLDLSKTEIEDIEPLKNLKKLQELGINWTSVRDIGPLKNLRNLRELNLNGLHIKDVSPLTDLKKLEELYLGWTKVKDLEPLRNLRNLKLLYLIETEVDDVYALKDLKRLSWLNIDDTKVEDISPLSSLVDLNHLSLSRTKVKDLSQLKSGWKLNRWDRCLCQDDILKRF